MGNVTSAPRARKAPHRNRQQAAMRFMLVPGYIGRRGTRVRSGNIPAREPLDALRQIENSALSHPHCRALPGRRAGAVQELAGPYGRVAISVEAEDRPSEVAVTRILPPRPRCDCTIRSARPLKALRWSAWNDSVVAALPLSTARSAPAPVTWKCTSLAAAGQRLP